MVVEAGLTVIDEVVADVLHVKLVPPVTEIVVETPGHIGFVVAPIVGVGSGLTVIFMVVSFAQAPLLTDAVYVVVVIGETVMEDVVAPVLHV